MPSNCQSCPILGPSKKRKRKKERESLRHHQSQAVFCIRARIIEEEEDKKGNCNNNNNIDNTSDNNNSSNHHNNNSSSSSDTEVRILSERSIEGGLVTRRQLVVEIKNKKSISTGWARSHAPSGFSAVNCAFVVWLENSVRRLIRSTF